MNPADIGMEPVSRDGLPNRAVGGWHLKMVFVVVLFLIALCTAVAVSGYVSDRLMAAKQQDQLDNAAERFNSDLNTAAGSDRQ